MIGLISVGQINVRPGQLVPPFLESLIGAARRGEQLLPYLRSIVASLGFDHFTYGIGSHSQIDRAREVYAFTTLPNEWVRRYEQMRYVEYDPRLFRTCKSAVPFIWDQSNVRGCGARQDAFYDDARAHGIASGVSFMLHGPWDCHVGITLDSCIERNDEIRLKAIARNLPEIHMFGHYFHEIFMLPAVEFLNEPRKLPAALSRREQECLTLAARGLTTKAISYRLAISSRTVQFHFDRIRGKLGVANRHEAIALGVQTGLVRAR